MLQSLLEGIELRDCNSKGFFQGDRSIVKALLSILEPLINEEKAIFGDCG